MDALNQFKKIQDKFSVANERKFKAIIDCNSFYCSCERVFRPDLHKKPVVSNLFLTPTKNNKRFLINTLDNLNFSMRDDVIKFASSGINTDWKMRYEFRSPRYTSRWKELRKVN